jgi:hypothetical protein
MTAYPGKGGELLEYAVESALGTAGSWGAIRQEEGTEFPTDEVKLELPSYTGRGHWGNCDDNPVTHENIQEGAAKLNMLVRGNSTVSSDAPLVDILRSAGLNYKRTTSVNLDGYTSGVAFSAGAAGSAAPGAAMALQADDGNHWPFIVANQPAAAAFNFIPGYAVPGAVAAPASNDLYGATCLTPRAQQVPTTTTLSFRTMIRQFNTTYPVKYTYSGCALSEVPKLTFEPGKPIKFDMSLHVADSSLDDAAFSSPDTVYNDDYLFSIWGGAGSQFAFATANTAGAITAGTYNLIKAEVDFKHKVVPIVGTGTTGTLNNIQGYMAVPGHAEIKLTMLCDMQFWNDIANGTFVKKYIHFAQAGGTVGAAVKPFFGVFFPRCTQFANPKLIDKRGDYVQCEVMYKATTANWNDVLTVDVDDTAPWAIVVGSAVAA